MKRMKPSRRIRRLVAWAVAAVPAMISCEAAAFDYEFHGFLESNVIVRDESGFQDGFLDDLAVIQQRNTLKFDIDGYLGYKLGDFSLDKAHLTFRGAYDTIFNIRYDEYKNIRKESPSRFDYGLYDIEYEYDLREATVDFVYQGEGGTGFLRLGRQLVSWGETAGLTITDNINPPDNSFQMFFLNPDDLKIPLWMGRVNYSPPPVGFIRPTFEFLAIPDIRPQQWSVLDGDFEAPYIAIHPFREFFGPPSLFLRELGLGNLVDQGLTIPVLFDTLGIDIREDVPTNDTEWGGRATFNIGNNLSVSGSYFEGISDLPGFAFADFQNFELIPALGITVPFPVPTKVKLVHPWTRTYGGSFNWFIPPPFDLILKGEFGRTEDVPIFLPVTGLEATLGPPYVPSGPPMEDWTIRGYTLKPVQMWMLGIDKDIWMRWFSASQVNVGIQWIHKQICDWEDKLEDSHLTKRNTDYFSLLVNWYWWHGRINPMIFALVDTQMDAMVQANVGWTITEHWYAKASMQSFWGKEDWQTNDTQSEFAPFVSTAGEVTTKIGFQW
ncbi:MAG: DUF1302 family protein [bacterium]